MSISKSPILFLCTSMSLDLCVLVIFIVCPFLCLCVCPFLCLFKKDRHSLPFFLFHYEGQLPFGNLDLQPLHSSPMDNRCFDHSLFFLLCFFFSLSVCQRVCLFYWALEQASVFVFQFLYIYRHEIMRVLFSLLCFSWQLQSSNCTSKSLSLSHSVCRCPSVCLSV